MKTYIIVIRDIVANVHTQPVTTGSLGGAIRDFQDRCTSAKPDDIIAMHPEHFELWVIGEYDDADGAIRSFSHDSAGEDRKQLAVGANFKRH